MTGIKFPGGSLTGADAPRKFRTATAPFPKIFPSIPPSGLKLPPFANPCRTPPAGRLTKAPMHPIHDTDPLLLLAVAMASKRRPAELLEIVAAVDLLQGKVPGETKFADTLARLAVAGLIVGSEAGLALTPAAQQLIEVLPRKGEAEERLLALKGGMGAYAPGPEQPPVVIAGAAILTAIQAHRAAAKSPAKNLLVPKPKAVETSRPGQRQRKPAPARRKP